jgi:hypothetical protein
MLSLKRFASLASSYGADLERWPAERHADARELLAASPEVQAIFAAVRAEDRAIGAARRREEGALWHPGEQDAALARLRSGVAARIASPPAIRSGHVWSGWLPPVRNWVLPHLGSLGFATSGGVALMAGLLIGSLSGAAPAPTSVLAAFQATPLHILAD